MSTLKVNNLQVGQDSTATNNLTWFQPGSPDGTIRLGSGNAGSATTKFTFDKDGNLTCVGDITANSIIAPIEGTLDDWIVHASDTNTKFGFPAADTFTVETAGSERLRIDPNGNITQGLEASATFAAINSISANAARGIEIFKDGTDTGSAIKLSGRPGDAGTKHYAQLGFSGANFTSHWATYNTSGTKIGEIVIGSTGKVGINQVSPDGMLHIWSATAGSVSADADADELVLENSGNVGLSLLTAGTGESSIYFGNPGTNGQKEAWIKYYHESHSTTANRRGLSFKTGGGSEKMKLDHAGRLLIGRESAYAHVDADNLIVGNEATNEHQGITILSHSGKYGGIYFGDGHNPSGHNRCKIIYDHPNDQFRIGTAGNSNQFYLDASGHMGLGISPSDVDSIGRALNIASSTGGAIYLQDTDAPTTKFAAISYNGATAALQIHAHHGSSYIDLGTNGTTALRIDSSGRVRTDNGTQVSDFDITRSNSTITDVMLVKGNAGNGFIRFQDNDSTCNWTLGADDGSGIGANGFILYNRVQSQYEWSVDNNGNMKVWDGDIQIGTGGHGIDFSANSHASGMASELLDYYEEGSWTPSFDSNSNGGTFPVASYIRVGRLVSISLWATVGGGSDSSAFKVTGLPFAPDKNGSAAVATNCNIACFARIYDSSNRFEVQKFDSTAITYANLSDKYISINATYRCNP